MKWRFYLYSLLGCMLFFSCYNEWDIGDTRLVSNEVEHRLRALLCNGAIRKYPLGAK